NPAAANLVEKISDYPGLSSWREFRADGETPSALDATFITDCPWVRAPYIEPLLHLNIDRQQDLQPPFSRAPQLLSIRRKHFRIIFDLFHRDGKEAKRDIFWSGL
ncbi:MAG: hypothetical protein KDD60_12475, partial [Bdellovibrionales bacterium]|nr:hypothetical protein [Bdellovibrionales bacterium]